MPSYVVRSMNRWLYPDDRILPDDEKAISAVTPRGGGTGVQILFCGLTPGDTLSAAFVSPAARFYCEVFRELPVRVEFNTGVHGFTAGWETAAEYATREAPFYVFDALQPVKNGVAIKGETEALYVSFTADAECCAGVYDCELRIFCGEESFTVPVTLEVALAAVPEKNLYITNWFSVSNMARSHGFELWSQEHWEMIKRYGTLMRRSHQNVFWLTGDLVEKSGSYAAGYTFDFTRAERLIRLYLGMGFKLIELSPLYSRGSWDETSFKITAPDGRFEALSEQGYTYAAAYLSALRDFLRESGLYDIAITHVGDEPHEKCAEEYRVLSGIIRKFLSGMPVIEAVETPDLRGAVDIWVPKNDLYSREREKFELMRKAGDKLWYYTCCIPGGKYCNRLLDMPLLRSRMLLWGNFKYELGGFLHWGLNFWRDDQDPFENTCPPISQTNRLPAGDSHIVYPLGGDVLGSMRLEQMRFGAEDYALLTARDRIYAERICSEAFRAFDDCDIDADAFDRLRRRMLTADTDINDIE